MVGKHGIGSCIKWCLYTYRLVIQALSESVDFSSLGNWNAFDILCLVYAIFCANKISRVSKRSLNRLWRFAWNMNKLSKKYQSYPNSTEIDILKTKLNAYVTYRIITSRFKMPTQIYCLIESTWHKCTTYRKILPPTWQKKNARHEILFMKLLQSNISNQS